MRRTHATDRVGTASARALERLSRPSRIYFPREQITKRELAEYFLAVSEWMLPQIAGRPIMIARCPSGVTGPRFFQKHPSAGTLKGLRRVAIQERQGRQMYAVVRRASDLVELAQIGALEIHTWGSQIDALEKPDRIVFDLDPGPGVAWTEVVAAARDIREFLAELGLVSFVKTSGGKGLHIVVPIARRHDWETVSEFCRDVAKSIARAAPDRFAATMAKPARHGRIFVDYLRNQRGATTVAAYSTRETPDAAVSMPIEWDTLGRIDSASHFRVTNALRHVAHRGQDPWAEMGHVRQSLTAAMRSRIHVAPR